jgi:hypothetical protein
MALALVDWLGRLLSSAARPASISLQEPVVPTSIEVERLPDYRWRELGFQQPCRRGDDPRRPTR